MTYRTTLRLLVGVVLLGGALLLVDQQKRVRRAIRTESQRVFDLATEPVEGISISRKDLTIECIKKGDDWFLKSPVRGRGNAAEVERLVAMLEMLDWDERITAEQRKARELTLADYGLEPPRVTVAVDTSGRRENLHLGDAMPFGKGLYARQGGSDAVLTIPAEVDAALPTSIESLRDRSVFRGAPESTVRLELQRQGAGFIQLVRRETGWMFQQPLSAYADGAEVQTLLTALYALQVESFFWDEQTGSGAESTSAGGLEMAASARVESCGLAADAAQIRVTVWVEGDSLGQELLLGKASSDQDGEVFANRGEINAIYTVADEIIDVCSVEVNALRDRRLFPAGGNHAGRIVLQAGETKLVLSREPGESGRWHVVEPVQWVADTPGIRELLERVASLSVHTYRDDPVTNLDAVGLSPPAFVIALQDGAPNSSEEPVAGGDVLATDGTLLIGGVVSGEQSRYAKVVGQDDVFTIAQSQLAWLDAACVAPLLYRDRTMLALEPDHVRRVMVSTSTGELGVERGADNEWVCVGETQLVPVKEVVDQILFVAGNVRAIRVEAHNPKELATYGLDVPATTVTFGLQGEEGIQKSLLVGAADGNGHVHAMVRGQDVVFLISETLASLLTRPLAVPAEEETGDSTPKPAAGEGD